MDLDHSRTVIHIDIDCFYAQVEVNKNPELQDVPLGIQQKNIVVTSNYKAREFGIKKCMFVSDAKKLCPKLVLVNGEDLHDYRQISYEVTNLLQKFSNLVERLGLDENFIDVTRLVEEKMKSGSNYEIIGKVFGSSEKCDCGCTRRLTIASNIAQELRNLIKSTLNLTTCAGIAHNKVLAKIVGSKHKPNQQTVVFPNSAVELMLSLNSVTDIPGIGHAIYEQLKTLGIHKVEDLQNSNLLKLESLFGVEKAKFIYDLSYGLDKSVVKSSGKPQSIGLEDSCKSISVEAEVKEKLNQLLNRLLLLVNEDGRIPKTIKLTVRKFEKQTKISHRETKQCHIPANLITGSLVNKDSKLLSTIMHLFSRIIDVKKPFHITLLGLSFTKFQNPPNAKSSIASFLRRDLEVQSVTSIENQNSVCDDVKCPTPSTSKALQECHSPTPSPKKLKLSSLVTNNNNNNKKRYFEDLYEDCESPSKLKVADLSLESISCPPDCDKDVFNELPLDLQKELWNDYNRKQRQEVNYCGSQVNKKAKPNTLFNYFVKN